MMMCIQNLVLYCQLVLKILSKNEILTSIKGRNSVANLRKTKIYNTNLDLVTDNVYTNFGLILSIRSQDIEQIFHWLSCPFMVKHFKIFSPGTTGLILLKLCMKQQRPNPFIFCSTYDLR